MCARKLTLWTFLTSAKIGGFFGASFGTTGVWALEDPWEKSRAADLYPKYFLLGAEGLALALLSLSSKSMSITSQITSIELVALDLSTLNFSKSGAWSYRTLSPLPWKISKR